MTASKLSEKSSPTGGNTSGVSPQNTWINHLPASMRPYIRLIRISKPIGTLLLFYPCAWSISMASRAHEIALTTLLGYLASFAFGSIIVRGAVCTINDMLDMDLDKAVERTRVRPLPNGDITLYQAFLFLAGQVAVAVVIWMQLDKYSVLLGPPFLFLVTTYPLMKRISYWPQAVLGLAWNWGALLGWSAMVGNIDWAVCLPLYAGGFCWTLVYDTIYAHQDKIDDVKVGIYSTALLFGEHTRTILGAVSVLSVMLIAYAGTENAQGPPFYFGVCLGAAQLARILWSTDLDDEESCWQGFVGCGWAGFWVWMGVMADLMATRMG